MSKDTALLKEKLNPEVISDTLWYVDPHDIKSLLEQERQKVKEEERKSIMRKIAVSLDIEKPIYADDVLSRLEWIFNELSKPKKEQE